MALSMDLRKKFMKAAARFDIGPATAVHWAKQVETTGDVAPWVNPGKGRNAT